MLSWVMQPTGSFWPPGRFHLPSLQLFILYLFCTEALQIAAGPAFRKLDFPACNGDPRWNSHHPRRHRQRGILRKRRQAGRDKKSAKMNKRGRRSPSRPRRPPRRLPPPPRRLPRLRRRRRQSNNRWRRRRRSQRSRASSRRSEEKVTVRQISRHFSQSRSRHRLRESQPD